MAELRDRLTLSEIIGRRVKLTRAGREFKGCCPFHHEKTPSFYINDDKQFYHCFGCGAHGDAVGFVMQHDNLSFIDAVETLSALAGLQVPQQSPQEVERSRQEKSLYSLLDDAASFFQSCLAAPPHKDASDYLKNRSITDDVVTAFRLGFAPADDQVLRRHLAGKGYTDAQMIEAGVLKPSGRGGVPYSFFRDRVMFPVTDKRGRVVAFGGRVLPESLRPLLPGAQKPPKYINSGETALFHKGRMLYGESHARQAAAEGQKIIVVEGYVDVIACFQAGLRGAVAPLGTALTEDQIEALWKIIPQDQKVPVLCFDGDEAGRRAAARACERILPLLAPDQSASFAFLPEGHDPDSLARARGPAALKSIIDAATPLVDFVWSHHAGRGRFETPEQRAGLEKRLNDEVSRIPDRTVQQHYRQVFRDRLYRAFGSAKPYKYNSANSNRPHAREFKAPPPVMPQGTGAHVAESVVPMVLLAIVINHPEIFSRAEEPLAVMKFHASRLDELRQAVIVALSGDPDLDTSSLVTHLSAKGFEPELKTVLSDDVYRHAGFARPGATSDVVHEGWQEQENKFRNLMAVTGGGNA